MCQIQLFRFRNEFKKESTHGENKRIPPGIGKSRSLNHNVDAMGRLPPAESPIHTFIIYKNRNEIPQKIT